MHPTRRGALAHFLRSCFLFLLLRRIAPFAPARQAQQSPARSFHSTLGQGQIQAVDKVRLLSEEYDSTQPAHYRVQNSRHVAAGLFTRLGALTTRGRSPVQRWLSRGRAHGVRVRQAAASHREALTALEGGKMQHRVESGAQQVLHSSNSWRVRHGVTSSQPSQDEFNGTTSSAAAVFAATAAGRLESAGNVGVENRQSRQLEAQVVHRSHGWFPAKHRVSARRGEMGAAASVHHLVAGAMEKGEAEGANTQAGRVSVPWWHAVTTGNVQGNDAVVGVGVGSRHREQKRQWEMARAKVAAQQSKQAGAWGRRGNPFLYNPNWPWRKC